MRPRMAIPAALLDLAAQQHRVLTTAQARRYGLSDRVVERLVRNGVWRRLDRGLVLVTGSPPTPTSYLAAGSLAVPDGFACGRTALALYGLQDAGPPIEIAHDATRHLTNRPWLTLRRTAFDRAATTSINGFSVLGIVDSLRTACFGLDRTAAADAVLRAVAIRMVEATALADAIAAVPNLPHRAALLEVLAGAADGLHSRLEIAYEDGVRRPHDLPRATRQLELPGGRSADLGLPDYRLLIELDGRSHLRTQVRDRRRDNRHSVLGWVTLRFGWEDVLGSPCAVAADVVEALVAAGWVGEPTRCPRCTTAA